MSEISKLKVNNTLYEIKDPNARNQLDKLHGIDGIEYNPTQPATYKYLSGFFISLSLNTILPSFKSSKGSASQ